MGRVTTNLRSFVPTGPVGCGALSCAFCYPDDADVAEALACPVAIDAQHAATKPATGRAVRMAAVPVPSVDDVFGRELADY